MPLTQAQQEMAERLGELLTLSSLDDEMKDNIIENLDKLPEEDVVKLIAALEAENDQVEKLVADIEVYLKEQEAGWKEVEQEQEGFVNKFVEKMAQALDDQAQIEELKGSL